MASRFIILITAEHVASCLWQDDRLVSQQAYAPTDAGRDAFARFLQDHGGEPISIFTDLVEEDYRFEAVPHLMGPDRAALFERKLDQYYRSTPYRHAAVQGRDKEGRRDDRVLFSALTNPGLLNPWVEMMARQAVPLRGIYSAPLVSRALLSGITASHVLLLSWEEHAGLRQTYFVGGNLRFTRLTGGVDHDNLVERAVSECALTVKYLASLSMLPADHPLDVCILCDAGDRRELAARLRIARELRYHYLETGEMARRIRYKGELKGSDATPLLLHALARKPPANHYANAAHAHFFSLWRLRRGLQAAAAAALLATLGVGLFNVWDAHRLKWRADELAVEARALEGTYRSLTKDFPKTGTTTENIKAAVTAAERIASYTPPPRELLGRLSRVLDAFPSVQIAGLSWQTSFNPEAPAVSAGAGTAAAVPEGALPAQVMLVSGEIWPFDGDYRRAMDTLDRLRAALAEQGLETRALKLPLDLRPESTLSGGEEAQSGGRHAQFELRIVWRRKA
ncbi:MAG TPA: hypothetical protein VLC55_06470 [Burkholderiales bacterium]|nr:hypothetical protein [Burkholderiales bacterium]